MSDDYITYILKSQSNRTPEQLQDEKELIDTYIIEHPHQNVLINGKFIIKRYKRKSYLIIPRIDKVNPNEHKTVFASQINNKYKCNELYTSVYIGKVRKKPSKYRRGVFTRLTMFGQMDRYLMS